MRILEDVGLAWGEVQRRFERGNKQRQEYNRVSCETLWWFRVVIGCSRLKFGRQLYLREVLRGKSFFLGEPVGRDQDFDLPAWFVSPDSQGIGRIALLG